MTNTESENQEPSTPAPAEKSAPLTKKIVITTVSVDFPSLNWGISIGEERELPDDAEAQAVILSKHYISLKK